MITESWRTWMRRCTRAAVVFVLLLSAGCGATSEEAPASDGGTPRIISLVPAATEMLFSMGAGRDMVGVSSFDRFPPEVEALPKVGALIDPDFERILTLRPTLVVVYASQDGLIDRLTRASIEMYLYRHATEDGVADIPRTLRELGGRVGRAAAAEAVAAGIERDIESVRERVGTRPRPSTALVFGREPGALRGIYVSGGVGFLHDVLEAAGGRNAFEDVPRESLQASSELMLTRRPDVIIELRTLPAASDVADAERAVWNRLAGLPAVKSNRVHILSNPALAIPGPRIAEAARAFLSVLHPDAP